MTSLIFAMTMCSKQCSRGIPRHLRERQIRFDMSIQEYWGVFFQYLTDKGKRLKINEIVEHEEGIAMASEILLSISRDEAERARLVSEYKYELDTQSKLVHAERKGEQKIIDLLRNGKSPQEIIREYGTD